MCRNCWMEYGAPSIVNDKTKKAAKLADAIHSSPDGAVGSYAHIVTDDWNLEDSDIEFCIEYAHKNERENTCDEIRQVCLEFLNIMLTMSKDERYSAMALHEKYFDL